MTNAEKQAGEIAALKAEIASLKAKVSPEPYDAAAAAKWASDMHAIREARMAHASAFSPEDLRAMEAAAPDDVCQAIGRRDARAPLGPTSPGPAGLTTPSGVPRPVGTGWREATPLGPVPGIDLVDRLLELDSARELGQRMVQQAKQRVAEEKVTDEKTNL